jgi:hypothetical protein
MKSLPVTAYNPPVQARRHRLFDHIASQEENPLAVGTPSGQPRISKGLSNPHRLALAKAENVHLAG